MKTLLLSSVLALAIASFGGCSQKAPTKSACDIYPNCVPSTTCATCVPCR